MDKFYISPTVATSWALTPHLVADRLAERWSGATIRWLDRAEDWPQSFYFTCTVEGERTDGSLDREGQCLVVEGSPRAAGLLLTWFRSLAKDGQELLAYNEAFDYSVAVTYQTSAAELEAVFNG